MLVALGAAALTGVIVMGANHFMMKKRMSEEIHDIMSSYMPLQVGRAVVRRVASGMGQGVRVSGSREPARSGVQLRRWWIGGWRLVVGCAHVCGVMAWLMCLRSFSLALCPSPNPVSPAQVHVVSRQVLDPPTASHSAVGLIRYDM